MPISKKTPIEKVIDDFESSNDPKFKGKSKAKRREMAVAAYMSMHNESVENGKPNADDAKAMLPINNDNVLGDPYPKPGIDSLADLIKNATLSKDFSPLLNFLKVHKVEHEPAAPDDDDIFKADNVATYDKAAHRQGYNPGEDRAAWDEANPDVDSWVYHQRLAKARQKAYAAMHDVWKGERD